MNVFETQRKCVYLNSFQDPCNTQSPAILLIAFIEADDNLFDLEMP
jgi:hypothetical protein